ncbi:MAG: hypothetical protein IMW85_03460 [Thermicanus sp.]|nr:hypothetical protein [Thermicanus sp.]
MKQEIQYGSPAIEILERVVRDIKQELEDQIELTNMGGLLTHEIGPFKLVSPDVKGVSLNLEERYRVRAFKNSIHPEYNGMNSFEVKVAEALDRTGKMWCRNPATKAGYAIPIPFYGPMVVVGRLILRANTFWNLQLFLSC